MKEMGRGSEKRSHTLIQNNSYLLLVELSDHIADEVALLSIGSKLIISDRNKREDKKYTK